MSLSALVAQLSSLVKGILVVVLWTSLDSLMLMLVRMLSVLVMVVWITLGEGVYCVNGTCVDQP